MKFLHRLKHINLHLGHHYSQLESNLMDKYLLNFNNDSYHFTLFLYYFFTKKNITIETKNDDVLAYAYRQTSYKIK